MPRVLVTATSEGAVAAVVEQLAGAPDVHLVAGPTGHGDLDLVVVATSELDERAVTLARGVRRRWPRTPVVVAVGAPPIGPVASSLALHGTGLGADAAALARLSPTERQLLELVAEGLTNREIGQRSGLAAQTVKNYLSAAFRKLGVSRRAEAVAKLTRGSVAGGVGDDAAAGVAVVLEELRASLERLEASLASPSRPVSPPAATTRG